MQNIRVIVLLICGIVFSISAIIPQELDSLIHQAIELSPEIKMLKAKRNTAYYKIDQNSNLPDPVLNLGLINMPTNSFSFTQEPMTQKVVGLSQSFPFPGSLGAVEEANAVDTLIVDEEIKDARNKIKMIMEQKYYELSFVRRARKLTEESLKLLETIAEVASTKYIVASASQQNVIKVQLQITNLLEKLEDLNSKEQSVLSDLNALLLRDVSSNLITSDYDSILFKEIEFNSLDSLARNNRPLLAGIRFSEKKARLNQNAAEKKYYPNINLQVLYGFRDKIAATNTNLNDFLSVMVGVTLPLNYGGKYSSGVEEYISMQDFYSEQYQQAIQNLNGRFGSIKSQLTSLNERIKLFEEGLLPQAQQNFNSALAGYQVDEVDFLNVIDAQDQMLNIETNLYRLKIDYLKEIAELEFLTGTEF
jgi:outer membrane protein, heavy metal efflux system